LTRSPGSDTPRLIVVRFDRPRCLIGLRARWESDSRDKSEATAISRFSLTLLIVYLLEAGLVLSVAPWTKFWDRNYFVEAWPWLEVVLTSGATRGAISALGVVSFVAGGCEAWSLVVAWHRARSGGARRYPALRTPDVGEEV